MPPNQWLFLKKGYYIYHILSYGGSRVCFYLEPPWGHFDLHYSSCKEYCTSWPTATPPLIILHVGCLATPAVILLFFLTCIFKKTKQKNIVASIFSCWSSTKNVAMASTLCTSIIPFCHFLYYLICVGYQSHCSIFLKNLILAVIIEWSQINFPSSKLIHF